jgi:hypothetical protein
MQCNGLSASVNSDDFRGHGFQSGYDPVWVDLLAKHTEQPFHQLGAVIKFTAMRALLGL